MLRCLPLFFLLIVIKAHPQKIIGAHQSKISYHIIEKISKNPNDSIYISASVKNIQQFLKEHKSFRFISFVPSSSVLILKIKVTDISNIIRSEEIEFVNEFYIPKEELTTGAFDLSLNLINYVHARFPEITGDSLRVTIKERAFDTTDIDLKGRIFKTGIEATAITPHASVMTTIIAGGANTSPFAKGAAIKSNVSSSSFLNLFADPDSIFQKNGITVQNHSYGTIVENFYGNEAVSYDAQANRLPSLLHVFSAGNSGNVTNISGPYAGITEYANLTGNYKHSKNSISVGSVDSSGQLMPLSSKGPAYDGRIKPEIMAYGEDGSSGAAALVSGSALLIQHAYKKNNSGLLPLSSLVKAILINSADDIGNPHVDFTSGFGKLNAFKAISTINDRRYNENSLIQNEIKNIILTIPTGAAKLKLTVVWNDPVASPNVVKALRNDIDMQLSHPSTGANWLPWVLDHSQNIAALQSIALRKIDSLNNVEQITIDNPVAGNYVIELKGSDISGSQPFSLAWQIDTVNSFYWTYPAFTDPLIAGNVHWLRWETNFSGQGTIEYATNGNNWRVAGIVPDLTKKYFRWNLPDTITIARLKMNVQSSGTNFISDSFTISPQLNMQVGFNCPDSFLLYWNPVHNGNYRLYEMGSRYLQSFTQTTDSFILLSKLQYPSIHYSVAPVINNKDGIKSNTINYTSLANDCYIKSFFLQTQNASVALFTAELGSFFNVAELRFEKLSGNAFIPVKIITNPSILQFSFSDSLLNQGENRYRLQLKLKDGRTIYSRVEVVYHVSGRNVFFYPNPVHQNERFKLITNESGRYGLQIADNNGRIIYQKNLNSNLTLIHASQFAKGIYFIRITDNKGDAFTHKLIIQ